MLPEEDQEYIEPASPNYTRDWHTPTKDEMTFGMPSPNFSPAYFPDDYTQWSARGCTAGNGEKFAPCGRTTINLSEVSIALL